MGQEGFDFDELKGQKYTEYKKVTCKVNKVKKAKAGLVFRKFDLSNKKKADLFVPFLKAKDALLAYKALKKDKKIHLVKDTALVNVTREKNEVTLDIIQGGMDAVAVTNGLSQLFKDMTLGLNVTGMPSTDEEGSDTSETSTDDKSTKKEERQAKRAEKKAKRAAKRAKMKEGVAKMDAAKDTAPKEKLDGNVAKYEAALATLITEAEADGEIDAEEQKGIDELTDALNKLKKTIVKGGKAPKKLTPERRAKIAKNMDQISARLDEILKKLGV